MPSSSKFKSNAKASTFLNVKCRHWIPATLLCLAIPCTGAGKRPTVIPPQGAGPDIGKGINSPLAKGPKTLTPAPSPVAQPRAPSPPPAPSHFARPDPSAVAPPVAQATPATRLVPVPTTVGPTALPIDPLPANPLPNATALKPAPSPVAATTPSSKPIPAQAAVAPTVPIAANVQSPPVDASGLDARSTTAGNPNAVLMPGQLTAKLNPLPGNLSSSGMTSQNFNYETKSQASCTYISTQAHAQRADTALVDFTGDGLIVSALPNEQLRASLQMAGYKQVTLGQPASWCLPAAAMSALLRAPASGVQRSSVSSQQKLVQVKGQWQLVQSTTAINSRSILNRKSPSSLQPQGQASKTSQRTG